MKFGAVPEEAISGLDLSLPPDPFMNTLVLTGHRAPAPAVYLGAAQWGDSSWNGRLFPQRTPANRFRQLYPQHFNAIELNATHYRTYPAETLEQWAAPARGRNFKFCPKFPQTISHSNNLQQTGADTEAFLAGLNAFGELLGPCFLQLSEHYAPTKSRQLLQYLASLPAGGTYFLELRHPDWFAGKNATESFYEALRDLSIGLVITDAPGRRDAAHMQLSIPKVMIRFVCNGTHPSSFQRMNTWTQRLQSWISNGLEEAYIFLHPGNEESIPELATYWIRKINAACELNIPEPGSNQPRLF